jgi:nucleotide-binding universal stress UspA family protein
MLLALSLSVCGMAQSNSKASKDARKEAKELKKQGWLTTPGALPLEKQLDRSYLMEMEFDENLYPKYIMANAQSIGENYDAAKTSALSLAITNLAGQIQTEVTSLIENTVANKQLEANEAASIVETVQSSKNLISQSIGRTITVVECYREVKKGGNKEVLVRIAYNGDMAKAAVKKAVRDELEKKGEKLHEQLDKVLGL